MSDLGPKRAFFWDEATQTFRKAVVGEPGEYVWNTTTNSWEFGTVGAEYLYNHTTKSWEFGPGGQYVRNQTTNAWDKVTSPGYGGRYYWDNATNSWLKNAASVDVAEAYARWDFLNNQAWFGGDYVGALSSTPGLSFTRASTGYAQTSAGVLVPFASGELRRTDKGALIEGARTNLFLRSQEFDDAAWTKGASSITANAVSAPDGTTTADKLVEDSATTFHTVSPASGVGTITATECSSVYAKAAERSWIAMQLGANRVAYFNLSAGTVGTTSGSTTATITALANGWYRCSIAGVRDTSTNNTIFVASGDGVVSYAGDGTSGVYIWGAQLEAAAFPSSYIPTTTASATRAADSLSVTSVTGLDYPLSLYAEFDWQVASAPASSWPELIRVYNGSSGSRLFTSPSPYAKAYNGDGIVAAQEVGSTNFVAFNAVQKTAAAYLDNGAVAIALNGGTVVSAGANGATNMVAPDVISFSFTPALGQRYLRRAAIYSRALTDAELQSLTT